MWMIWNQRRWLRVYDDGTLSVHVDRITGCSVLVDHLQLIACRRPLRRQLRQRWKQMKRVAFNAKMRNVPLPPEIVECIQPYY